MSRGHKSSQRIHQGFWVSYLIGSEVQKNCFKTSDKDGNMGSIIRDVLPSQGLLQSAIQSQSQTEEAPERAKRL